MPAVERHFYEFDAFRLEVEERRLVKDRDVLTLTPRAFDILLTLVQNAGKTVDKDALIDAVWRDTFVEEGNLNRHVSTLRRILGDDPREQRYIKTIPKRGYRFTANVTETVESAENVAIDSVRRGRLTIKEETFESFWTRPRVGVAAVLLSIVGLTGLWALWNTGADARGAISLESQASYEKARELWRDRTPASLHDATLLLENVVHQEPRFALAHAALADAYAFDYGNWKKAEAAAAKAIELDPAIGEPHASIGFVRMFWQWRLGDAEAEFKKAVELSPYYATGRQWFALNLAATSHVDAALVEIQKAHALESDSLSINIDYCQLLYYADRFDTAIHQCREVLSAYPTNARAHELLSQIYTTAGSHDLAVDEFLEYISLSKSEAIRNQAGRFREAYDTSGVDGFRATQLWFYSELEKSDYKRARILAESGEFEKAVLALERARDGRDFDLVFYAPDPAFQAIRQGPFRASIDQLPLR